MRDRKRERGNQTVEFTMIGIPLLFILFGVANMSFAMLTLHTIQEACEQGARYVVTHGSTCSTGGNTCGVTVGNVASVISSAAAGVNPSQLTVTLTVCAAGVNTCPASGAVNQVTCSPLSSCTSSSTAWPSSSNNTAGSYDVIVSADCTVASPIFMYWPGKNQSVKIPSSTFHAYSRQLLMF
jgi:Flp pilus assembly protein TadG